MKKYLNPDFDITVYEVENLITASSPNLNIGTGDPDGGDWWG